MREYEREREIHGGLVVGVGEINIWGLGIVGKLWKRGNEIGFKQGLGGGGEKGRSEDSVRGRSWGMSWGVSV